MIPEPILMYTVGVTIGASITLAIVKFRSNCRSDVTEALLVETIGQTAYLRATKEVVDDETDEKIKNRGAEILEEYDLDVVASEVSSGE